MYVVIGSHGRGRVSQLLLGSTAAAVARRAMPAPVVSHLPEDRQFQNNTQNSANLRSMKTWRKDIVMRFVFIFLAIFISLSSCVSKKGIGTHFAVRFRETRSGREAYE